MDGSLLKQLQDVEFDILCKFDDFCRTNHIDYTLYAGTLLGAVRHKGFIPWDDDVDVAMTRGEYAKFCEAVAKSPIEEIYFENYQTDKSCGTSHGKLRKLNTIMLQGIEYEQCGRHEVFIDVFPLDKMSHDKGLSNKTRRLGRRIVMLTRSNVRLRSDSFAKKAVRAMYKIIPAGIRFKSLNKCAESLRQLDRMITEDYEWCSMSTLNNIDTIRIGREIMESFSQVEFNGRMFKSVSDREGMLTQLYGDYMKLPPESDRVCTHNPVSVKL
ncbi:MAG: LicD family protein [Saccharofermentans sp.]|nr:LicD family protein [Saccharofermentans sp.]